MRLKENFWRCVQSPPINGLRGRAGGRSIPTPSCFGLGFSFTLSEKESMAQASAKHFPEARPEERFHRWPDPEENGQSLRASGEVAARPLSPPARMGACRPTKEKWSLRGPGLGTPSPTSAAPPGPPASPGSREWRPLQGGVLPGRTPDRWRGRQGSRKPCPLQCKVLSRVPSALPFTRSLLSASPWARGRLTSLLLWKTVHSPRFHPYASPPFSAGSGEGAARQKEAGDGPSCLLHAPPPPPIASCLGKS
ncbi:PREDICTED: nascent polypeptide-associated complex subunit alpha, muscle-specific form-like [Cercocebus atys]|uniref:nascent polypeptide-associated complex subunit alpha, muscle-specific form-like n=1 Tax=Cercocebus atys TaxID=9531 RepID=UPI0005F43A6D|nr:PREDICTED: nascent polypeptide-associated complex subunit alpha, muscle-specific form-like [Cercocebus atys]